MKKPLEVFQSMSEKNNQDLKLIPFSNINSVKSGKNGWGELSIAIPNECVADFLMGEYKGGLIFCHATEYDKEQML